MDTRIGYPNEHLANTVSDEIASPMYATGVGLVLKGFEKMEKQDYQEPVKETVNENPKEKKKVSTHSNKTKGSFFDKIFTKGKEFFEDEDSN